MVFARNDTLVVVDPWILLSWSSPGMTHLVTPGFLVFARNDTLGDPWIHGLGMTHFGFMVFRTRNDTLGDMDSWIPGLRQE